MKKLLCCKLLKLVEGGDISEDLKWILILSLFYFSFKILVQMVIQTACLLNS